MSENDVITNLEAHNKIPTGWMLFFIGVIVWLIYYIYAYTPAFTGWSQYKILKADIAAMNKPATEPRHTSNPFSGDAAHAQAGMALFSKKCATCHGKNLEGDSGPALSGPLTIGTDDLTLYAVIAKGRKGGMPPFGKRLKENQIWELVTFIQQRHSQHSAEKGAD